jgi:hypothetical protein
VVDPVVPDSLTQSSISVAADGKGLIAYILSSQLKVAHLTMLEVADQTEAVVCERDRRAGDLVDACPFGADGSA